MKILSRLLAFLSLAGFALATPEQELNKIKKLAESEDAIAQLSLGLKYDIGTSVPMPEPEPQLSVRDRRINREAAGFSREYRRFLENSRLSDDTKTRLLRLVAERALLVVDRYEGLKSGRFASNLVAGEFYKRENARLDAEIRTLVGPEYNDFWAATEKIPAQRQIDIFSSTVKQYDVELTQEQKYDLVDIYWAKYKEQGVDMLFSAQYSRVLEGNYFPEQMTKRSIADQKIVAVASEFLSSVQLEQLKAFQRNQIEMFYSRSKLPGRK